MKTLYLHEAISYLGADTKIVKNVTHLSKNTIIYLYLYKQNGLQTNIIWIPFLNYRIILVHHFKLFEAREGNTPCWSAIPTRNLKRLVWNGCLFKDKLFIYEPILHTFISKDATANIKIYCNFTWGWKFSGIILKSSHWGILSSNKRR